MLLKNKGVSENEASVARPASPQFVPYAQGIAVAQALLPVRLVFVPNAQGIAMAQALLPVRLAFVPNAQGNSRGFPTPGRLDGHGGGGRSGAGRASPKKKMLFNDERSWNVHENKQKGDTFTEKEYDISTHFTQEHAYFAETGGFFVTFEVLGNESRTSNVETRVHRFHPWLMTFSPCGAAALPRL
jgi:hypothetical protein